MRFTGIVRPVDEMGRVVLPMELRRSFNIQPKDLMEIFVEEDMIILKRSRPSCVFCHGEDELMEFDGKLVCKKCVRTLFETDEAQNALQR